MGANPSFSVYDSAFPTTQWTVVIEAVSGDSTRAAEALARLCGAYREPIVNWFRRKDYYADPEDLTHGFIGYVLEKKLLEKAAGRTGRFRAFLAAALQNYLRDTWDKAKAHKRGGEIEKVPLQNCEPEIRAEPDSESQLDIDFALMIHRNVMGKLDVPAELQRYIFEKDGNEEWGAVAARLSKTSEAVRKEVSRLRRKHWEYFRDEVSHLVTPDLRPEETRYLYTLLFRNVSLE